MRALAGILRRRPTADKAAEKHTSARSTSELWECVSHFAAEIQGSSFMAEMTRHLDGPGGQGLMGALDCATLYGLTRWQRPTIVVETGGYLGMSSAFILKALADEGLAEARLYSLEMDRNCDSGAMIPTALRSQFIPMRGRVEDFVERDELPPQIDMFLHDSSHRYRHMLWEFRQFWKRLGDGGLLVSHDVHFNAAFAEFVAKTHSRDRKGVLDAQRTTHHDWGRWGYIGFVVKKSG
jgi:predicted O-methyltransferase YrrM